MRFTSTPRGARLARRLVSHRLHEWGHPYGVDTNDTLTLITAELTSNAVRHGHVPGRDFHLRLTQTAATLRIEVTDTRTEKQPLLAHTPADATSGRGLLLVAALATHWGVTRRTAAPGKTVWAELHLRSTTSDNRSLSVTGCRLPPSLELQHPALSIDVEESHFEQDQEA
ncbi:ATP-binding protein [Streptomyces sp. ISL-99]|uniref:ATP-binding protein n=1 Tax=Streptomyces sp. ISL-99 TaxID=2819193 RepID=UPI001BE8073C|nr:ATP-binding protein [Streptomyces sp. ISL-99]MBT2528847.1 ATP-binding protein [Streptomyces sp. ISL-99]